jgi:hypothetical protein
LDSRIDLAVTISLETPDLLRSFDEGFRSKPTASDVISARKIRLAWLEQVLNSPEHVEADRDDPELMHHVGRIEEHGNRALRVVIQQLDGPGEDRNGLL